MRHLPLFMVALACGASASMAATKQAAANLSGYNEVPALSTPASGSIRLRLVDGVIEFKLEYRNVASGVTQAHIHFGQPGTSGGISAFLCSNLDDPVTGEQDCPAGDATVTGTIAAEDIIGPTTQGIAVGDFAAFIDALAKGATYANVHSVTYPGGEIRGQIKQLP